MKNLFKVALVAIAMLLVGNFAQAQSKVGYINFGEVVRAMPEFKTMQTQLDAYQKQFADQFTVMSNEYQAKGADFQKGAAGMTDAVRAAKQTELQDLQKRIQDYQTDAQQKIEAKSNELSKPLVDKARAALTEVAKEKGYTYVLDSGTTNLLVSPEADDLAVAVKTKLGLK
jgi:outer membrane protein